MLKIYGSMLCPDCIQCRNDLDKAKVEYSYLDFAENLKNLKEFLDLRDNAAEFQHVKECGAIGIPCIVTEDGKIHLTWEHFM